VAAPVAASDDTPVAPEMPVETAFAEEAMPDFLDESESPETTSPALAHTAPEGADDFASELLVDTADLDLAVVAAPAEPPPQTATAEGDRLAASWTDTGAPSAPLPPTPGALDALIATIDAEIQRSYTPGAGSIVRQRVVDGDGTLERYLLFTMQGRLYAIAVPHVLEVGRLPAITPVPNVPVWLRGVINLRGEILSVIDVRTFLGCEDGHYTESSRMLVVKALGDDMTTALVVDQIKGFVQLPKAGIQTPPLSLEDKVAPYLTGTSEYAEQTLAVLDLERFLRAPEIRQFE
jgi:purine-binding chemotaxis protein CheW